jgi:hypothetical protein
MEDHFDNSETFFYAASEIFKYNACLLNIESRDFKSTHRISVPADSSITKEPTLFAIRLLGIFLGSQHRQRTKLWAVCLFYLRLNNNASQLKLGREVIYLLREFRCSVEHPRDLFFGWSVMPAVDAGTSGEDSVWYSPGRAVLRYIVILFFVLVNIIVLEGTLTFSTQSNK